MALLMMLALLGCPQDVRKDSVEGPLKERLGPVSGTFDLSKSGIPWVKGLDAALNRGKPILLFQLLGNLNDVYC